MMFEKVRFRPEITSTFFGRVEDLPVIPAKKLVEYVDGHRGLSKIGTEKATFADVLKKDGYNEIVGLWYSEDNEMSNFYYPLMLTRGGRFLTDRIDITDAIAGTNKMLLDSDYFLVTGPKASLGEIANNL